MNKQETVRTLTRLHKICKAGEKGFNIVANMVRNRGLKVLLKTYAQQRRRMASELGTAIEALGGSVPERRSLRGMIHRGRIAITATLSIGQAATEAMALKEAMVGEKAALRAYDRALSRDLPADIRAMVQKQQEEVQETSRQVSRLRGLPGDRLVVRLCNSEDEAEVVVTALEEVGFNQEAMEVVELNRMADHYDEENSIVGEAVISGAVGGAIWGGVFGAIAGLGILLVPGIQPVFASTIQGTWAFITLSGIVCGAILGMILGFFIGLGVAEEDAYIYDTSMKQGTMMILLHTNRRRAPEASEIMRQPGQPMPLASPASQ